MVRPASRIKTFNPFSVSSFAAQPPVIPEPTISASYVFVAIFSPGLRLADGSTTMLRAGNNLEFQFFFEGDLRSVEAMKCDVLEDDPERPFHLRVRFRHGVSVARWPLSIGHKHVVNGAELCFLLLGGGVNEILAVKLITLFVDVGEPFEK